MLLLILYINQKERRPAHTKIYRKKEKEKKIAVAGAQNNIMNSMVVSKRTPLSKILCKMLLIYWCPLNPLLQIL